MDYQKYDPIENMTFHLMSQDKEKVNRRILEYSIIFLFFALYVWNISQNYWTLPEPGDPLEYLGSLTGNGIFWPWLDRLALAIGLNSFSLIFSDRFLAGMVYIGFINGAIMLLCLIWSYIRAGFIGSLLVGVIFNASFMTLGYATYIYPNQTEALYSLMAFFFFFSKKSSSLKIFLSGLFTAFAVSSKITGIAVPVFLVFHLIYKKRSTRELTNFVLGILIGTTLVWALFAAFYDIQSLISVFKAFFTSYLDRVVGSQLSTNLASFLDILLSTLFLPVFIAIFICLSGYKNEETRRLYFVGCAYILVIYVIFSFTKRGHLPFPHYIYSTFIYLTLGLAVYLGQIFQSPNPSKPPLENRRGLLLTLGFGALSFVIIGARIGSLYPPALKAARFSDIFPQADIFKPGYGNAIPLAVRLLYLLGPLIVIALLAFIEYTKSKTGIMLFILSVSLWSSAFNGGIALKKASEDRLRADFFFKSAPLLNEVRDRKFFVFMRSWQQNPEFERILWAYRIFFNQKYLQYNKNTSAELRALDREIKENIRFILDEKEIIGIGETTLLTDDLNAASKYLKAAEIMKKLSWENSTAYIIKPKPFAFDHPIFESDYKDWPSTGLILTSDRDKLIGPMSIGVLRGKFRVDPVIESGRCSLRLALVQKHETEDSCIQVGYYGVLQENRPNGMKDGDIVAMKIKARLLRKTTGSARLFAQHENTNWIISSEDISGKEWKEYTVFQRMTGQPRKIQVGVWFLSEDPNEILEIQHPRIYIESPEGVFSK